MENRQHKGNFSINVLSIHFTYRIDNMHEIFKNDMQIHFLPQIQKTIAH
jgi:hypothetical protein